MLGGNVYTTAIDIWSTGCVLGELLNVEPLFKGRGSLEQITIIFQVCGTPTEETWPGVTNLPGFPSNIYNYDGVMWD